jgi:thymidylate kinase
MVLKYKFDVDRYTRSSIVYETTRQLEYFWLYPLALVVDYFTDRLCVPTLHAACLDR